jgi:hypothetical protein
MLMIEREEFKSYEDKIAFLRHKLRDSSDPNDLGFSKLNFRLGLCSNGINKRLKYLSRGNLKPKMEWELAADALIYELDYEENLIRFAYEIK